jgi:hypothetical protein
LVGTMHNICKVWGSNPGHHQKTNRHFKNIVLLLSGSIL